MKKLVLTFLICAILVGLNSCLFSQSKSPKEKEQIKKFEELSDEAKKNIANLIAMLDKKLKHRFTPEVLSVEIFPARPKQDEPIKVTAIVKDNEMSIDTTKKVYLYYSLDNGKKWKEKVILEKKKGEDIWVGTIPPIKKKGRVIYYIWAQDSSFNVYSDIPCKVSKWPPFDDGCMVPIAADNEPVDDEMGKVIDNLDLWEIKVGMDDKYFYIHQNVEGEISGGTMEPLKANAYVSVLFDPREIANLNDISVFIPKGDEEKERKTNKPRPEIKSGKFISYAPLGPFIHKEVKACFIGYNSNGKPVADEKNISCKKDGSDLVFRIKKEVLKDIQNYIGIVGGMTFYVNDPKMPLPYIQEFSPFSTVKFEPRYFEVQ